MGVFTNDIGTSTTIKFLRDYAEFGCFAHSVASDAFHNSLLKSTSSKEKKLLATKNFMELMNAIEDLAGLCVAIKHREDGLGLIYGFITYNTKDKNAPATKVREFLDAIEQGVDPISFLGFPDITQLGEIDIKLDPRLINEINTEMAKRNLLKPGQTMSSIDLIRSFYKDLYRIFQAAANTSTAEDSILVKAYNQVKHGFKVIEDSLVFHNDLKLPKDDQCLILVKNPAYTAGNSRSTPLLDFSIVDVSDFDKIRVSIILYGKAVKVICFLTAALLEMGQIETSDNKI